MRPERFLVSGREWLCPGCVCGEGHLPASPARDSPGGAERGPYLGRYAPQAAGVAPAAGVCARGPGDCLVVEDGEGELAVRDEHRLERVDLPKRGLSAAWPQPYPHPWPGHRAEAPWSAPQV